MNMARQRSGWFGESRRHSLASRGIKTGQKKAPRVPSSQQTQQRGTVKYCGFLIGKEITPEEVERLFNFLHANYTVEDFIAFDDEDLHNIALENQEEWRENPLAILTPEEDKAWEKTFGFYVDDQGLPDTEADRKAWADLQQEFPRLKRYAGVQP